MLWLHSDMKRCFQGEDVFQEIFAREGKVVRHKEGRKTFRFEFEGKAYYAKAHAGIGWSEIFKNLLTCKWPVIDASNEWHAIRRLNQVGVPTAELVGYGARGWNPARRQSFVLMRELKEQVELEAFFLHMGGLKGRRRMALKRQLIQKVAEMTRHLHSTGINHRDLYLCHYQIEDRDWEQWSAEQPVKVVLLDLHRAQARSTVPRRWLIKDLGALLYSSMDKEVNNGDIMVFLEAYSGSTSREFLRTHRELCRKVIARAQAFCVKHHGARLDRPGSIIKI